MCKTDCPSSLPFHPDRKITTRFDGGRITSDAGLLLFFALDRLLGARQEAVENALARRHLQENTLVLYDVTSVYLEGHHCELAL